MADDVAPGVAFTAAADEIGGVKYQRVKISHGADGSATDASTANPLPVAVSNANANGQATAANSAPVVLASDKLVKGINGASNYETFGASASNQMMGATGAAGDHLSHIVINPGSTTPGNLVVKDGSTTVFTFAFGTLANTAPFHIFIGMTSVNGGWNLSTGLSIGGAGVGSFT